MGGLVGFLGSGKTTTLNHLLKGVHGKKIAVVVNEFGAVDVDSALVAREVTADAEADLALQRLHLQAAG